MKLFGLTYEQWNAFLVQVVPLVTAGLAYIKAARAKHYAKQVFLSCSYPKCGHVCKTGGEGDHHEG